MQPEERSLHLLLWTAAQRKNTVGTDMQGAGWTKPDAVWARSTTLAPGDAPSPRPLRHGSLPADGDLSLTSVRSGEEAAVTVRGEVDCASARLLANELGDLLRQGACRLTVSLAEVTFIDSTGLATLVSALRAARAAGGDVVLHAPKKSVRKVLAITGADRFFVLT